MKNSLLLSLIATGTILPAAAATLSPEQALDRFNSNRPKQVATKSDLSSKNLKLQSTIGNLYVFSSEGGFLVLPNEDSAPVLLGYSDSGKFDVKVIHLSGNGLNSTTVSSLILRIILKTQHYLKSIIKKELKSHLF